MKDLFVILDAEGKQAGDLIHEVPSVHAVLQVLRALPKGVSSDFKSSQVKSARRIHAVLVDTVVEGRAAFLPAGSGWCRVGWEKGGTEPFTMKAGDTYKTAYVVYERSVMPCLSCKAKCRGVP